MKKKLHELTREEYETLYRSGFMGEFYPDASGCYEKDVEEYIEERMNVIGQNGNDGEHYFEKIEEMFRKDIREAFELRKEREAIWGKGLMEEMDTLIKNSYKIDANNLDGFNLGTYQRAVKDKVIDIYDILELYKVYNPATAHAIKKLLMPGKRGNKGVIQDLEEAKQSITRAIELEKSYHEGV